MYYIIFGFIYIISLLPFFILYGISDISFLIIYYIIGYRKKIVMTNLRNSFPGKTEKELKKIARKFYRNFTDNWIEFIKLFSISKKNLNKRTSGNFKILYELFEKGRSVQANLGHFFNWEIMTLYSGIQQPFIFLTVYLPQSSRIITRLLVYVRGRWGNPQLPATDMARAIIPWRKKSYLLALGGDQSPSTAGSSSGNWLYFMNQPTAFMKSAERFARSQNLPVIMMTTTRPKRGHYHFNYFLLEEDPKNLPEGELTRRYVQRMEENIYKQPELYLWSHRRWKHPWKPEYENLRIDVKPMP